MKLIMEGWRGYLVEAQQDIVELSNELLKLIHQVPGFESVKFKNKPTPRRRKISFTDVGGRGDRHKLNTRLASSFPEEITVIEDGYSGGTYKRVPYSFQEGRVGKEGTPQATKFEENLANALNSVGGGCTTNFRGAGSQFNELAAEVIASSGATFFGKCFEKLPNKGVELSQLYAAQGVSSKAPKTDLISTDNAIKISVKKEVSQFISAQAAETAAVYMAVVENNPQILNKSFGARLAGLIKKYFSYEQGYANLKELEPADRPYAQTIRKFFLNSIQHPKGLTINDHLVREALLGEHKFAGGPADPAVPNYFLVWDENGSGKLFEAEKFVKIMQGQHEFGVRGRGEKRGLAFRGEKAK